MFFTDFHYGRRETGDGRRETGDGGRETGDGRRETGDKVQKEGETHGRRQIGHESDSNQGPSDLQSDALPTEL